MRLESQVSAISVTSQLHACDARLGEIELILKSFK